MNTHKGRDRERYVSMIQHSTESYWKE